MPAETLCVASGAIGRSQNSLRDPHHVRRSGGTSLWMLEYGVSGRGWIRTPSAVLPIAPGDFFIYQPLVAQDYGMDRKAGNWDHIWITFSPRPHWHDWLNWPEVSDGIRRLHLPDPGARRQLRQRLEHALRIFFGTHTRRHDLVLNVLEELLITCDAWNPAGRTARLDDRIRTALQHLCDHATEKITLQNLARVCGLSPSRLSHLFKEQVGETPLQYLEQRRMETARDLLQMTSKPVSQVAYEVGFGNPFYFSRIYRRRMGIPPSATRPRPAR